MSNYTINCNTKIMTRTVMTSSGFVGIFCWQMQELMSEVINLLVYIARSSAD